MKHKFLILFYVWLLLLLTAPTAMALLVNIPGQPNAGNSPKDYIQSVYNFGRVAVGAVAFGVIVYAALEYTASAGNTARQEDARSRIKEAILGIILLFGATILFNLINPQILSFTNPPKTPIKAKTTFNTANSNNPNLTDAGK